MRSSAFFIRGVTAMELLISLAILAMISGIVVSFFSGFRESKVLDTGVEDVVSLLNEARLDTLSSKSDLQYGVHFESGRMVLFRGTVFSEPNVDNVEVVLNSVLEISNIALTGGGANVLFDRLTGKTSQYGAVTLRVKNAPSRSVLITIEPTGVASF